VVWGDLPSPFSHHRVFPSIALIAELAVEDTSLRSQLFSLKKIQILLYILLANSSRDEKFDTSLIFLLCNFFLLHCLDGLMSSLILK
jgi:hypothetical protein